MNGDFMAVLKVRVFETSHQTKTLVEAKQLVARDDIDLLTVKGDSSQTTVPASSAPINIYRIPVHGLEQLAALSVNQVDTTVALPWPSSTNNGSRN